MATFSLHDVRAVCKPRDAWWTVLLVDPLAVRLTRLLANRTSVTPDQLTTVAFLFGLAAAGAFALASPGWLLLGALLYHLGFVLDCCDGKIARLKGTGTPFGGWLDFMLDRVRDGVCAIALVGGQYAATGEVAYLWAGFAIIGLDMFRYLNGPQIAKARRAVKARSRAASFVPPPRGSGAARRGTYRRIRAALLRRRIRTHLVSGIEFQMATFIIGPVTGMVIGTIAVAGALLLMFELVLIYRFWRSLQRTVPVPQPRPDLAVTQAV